MTEKQDKTKIGQATSVFRQATSVFRDFGALAAAVGATIIGIALVAVLQKAVGIDDSATTVALLLVPLLVYGIVSGRLTELTGPGGLSAKFAKVETELREIHLALRGILTKHEFGPLKALDGIGRVEIKQEPNLMNYLHRLDGLNFIQPNEGRLLNDIKGIANGEPFDLKEYVHITDDGRTYLEVTTKLNIFKSGVDWRDSYPWTPLPPSQ